MSFNLGGSSGKTTETGKTEPWAPQQGYLLQGFDKASQLLGSDQPQYYPGSTVAPTSNYTTQGLQSIAQQADKSSNTSDAFMSGLRQTASGSYLPNPFSGSFYNPNANSYAGVARNPNASIYSGVATNKNIGTNPNAYIDDVTKSVSRNVIPSVMGSYAIGGRTGSSPIAQQAMAKGIADVVAPYQYGSAEAVQNRLFNAGESQASREQSALSMLASQLFGAGESQAAREQAARSATSSQQYQAGENALTRGLSSYDAERSRMLQAAGLAPSIDSLGYSGANNLLQAGQIDQEQAQRQLSDDVSRWDFNQNVEADKLRQYMDLIQGNYGSIFSSSGSKSGSSFGLGGGK